MKSKYLLSSLFIAFTMLVSAKGYNNFNKESYKSKSRNESFFKLGLKLGYDMYPLTYKPEEITNQLQNGYQWGGSLQMGYSLYLQPEVYYALYPDFTSRISSDKIPGIRAPLLIGFRFLNLKVLSLHIMGGPVLYAPLSDLQEEITMEKFTYDWQVGAGVKFFGFLSADLRYQMIRGTSLIDQYNNLQNSTLNVIVGIKL